MWKEERINMAFDEEFSFREQKNDLFSRMCDENV